ncbi:MAG: DNA mismatch repair endonuclease MutL [Peptoniphilaceae bacterium]|nr:DNA mismatch repair endonuclease MutL [Peptoniphilaceae bacterium]
MKIKQLDNDTIEKIAAGEIIESPVSVVKELVENSIDANSEKIIVEIKNGGKSYIRVTDDGDGIDKDEIDLAFKSHATSKIEKFDDLYKSMSLGFRGEALSSISSVSKIELITKTKYDELGIKTTIEEKIIKNKKSIATNNGTTFIIKDLFFNTPVRKKFLKSDISESNKITKIMYIFAISHPLIEFKYIKDNREIFRTYKNNSIENNIIELIDSNLEGNLIKIDYKSEEFDIYGYTSSENYYRGNRTLEYLFVNGRYVFNDNFSKIIENNYKSIIPNGRFPSFFLFMNISPSMIDINIHPNKKDIKFSYEEEVLTKIDEIIFEKLNNNTDVKKIRYKNKKENEIIDFYSDYEKILNKYNIKSDYKTKNINEESISNENKIKNSYEEILPRSFLLEEEKTEYKAKKNHSLKFENYIYKTTIFKRYSIFENNEMQILILDAREADKKIRFEKYLNELNTNNINLQRLVDPIIYSMKKDEFEKIKYNLSKFKKIGFELEIFGENSIILRSVPFIFENPENEKFFYEILDNIQEDDNILLRKIYEKISYKSFKRGDFIDKNEATNQLKKLSFLENPFFGYTGKACLLLINSTELEKYFG